MPGFDAVDAITIDATPERVFETVLDYANIHTWWKGYRCEIEGDGPVREGSRVRHRIHIPVVQPKPSFLRTVRKIVPGARIEETYDGGDYIGTGVWTFEQNGRGTVATFTCRVRSNTLMAHIGAVLLGARGHHAVYRTGLAGLKACCESPGRN